MKRGTLVYYCCSQTPTKIHIDVLLELAEIAFWTISAMSASMNRNHAYLPTMQTSTSTLTAPGPECAGLGGSAYPALDGPTIQREVSCHF